MEISEQAIRLTYDESKVLSASLMLEEANNPLDQRLKRISRFLINHAEALSMLAIAQLNYALDDDPDTDLVEERLKGIGESYLAIPRDSAVEDIVPKAISELVWCFADSAENLNSAQSQMIELATKMSVELTVCVPRDQRLL